MNEKLKKHFTEKQWKNICLSNSFDELIEILKMYEIKPIVSIIYNYYIINKEKEKGKTITYYSFNYYYKKLGMNYTYIYNYLPIKKPNKKDLEKWYNEQYLPSVTKPLKLQTLYCMISNGENKENLIGRNVIGQKGRKYKEGGYTYRIDSKLINSIKEEWNKAKNKAYLPIAKKYRLYGEKVKNIVEGHYDYLLNN